MDLPQHAVDNLARVFEGAEDFLSVAQPVRVDLEHRVEILHVGQVLFQFRSAMCRITHKQLRPVLCWYSQ